MRSHLGDSGEVIVAVRDSGVGISGDQMRSLFQAFFTTKATGMGMGLRGSKRLMDTFEIQSSPKGTHVLARKFVA